MKKSVPYLVYSSVTREIKRTGWCLEEDVSAQAINNDEATLSLIADDSLHYINPSTLERMDKQTTPITVDSTTLTADGVDKVTFSSIPTSAEIFVNAQTVGLCDDGVFEFSSDTVGSHTITIKKVEFLDYQVIINAV
jgi:hypothetical protein